jgi:hypothetical protein
MYLLKSYIETYVSSDIKVFIKVSVVAESDIMSTRKSLGKGGHDLFSSQNLS